VRSACRCSHDVTRLSLNVCGERIGSVAVGAGLIYFELECICASEVGIGPVGYRSCIRGDALLFPIDWPEPFGLVMIEAMACGTPVIAYRSGSVPEVVEHGVTGFIVENEEQAVAAVHRLGRLDRRKIRTRFEERFTATRMAKEYESQYRKLTAAAALQKSARCDIHPSQT